MNFDEYNPEKWRANALAELGFGSFSELSKKSKIHEGTISKISRGILGLADEKAHMLIEAVINQNYHDGITYQEGACKVADAFNYLRNHFSHYESRKAKQIGDKDVYRWCYKHFKRQEAAQADLDEHLEIIKTSTDTKESLKYISDFLKRWEMKHDFGHFDKVKDKFNSNKLFIIPHIEKGMKSNFYSDIEAIFTDIWRIAHLCEEFGIVTIMSDWLITRSSDLNDIQTEVKAKVALAWTLTSSPFSRERCNLFQAQELVKALWKMVKRDDFLEYISPKNMDIIAVLCELRLRLAIRLYVQKLRPLPVEKFYELLEDSRNLLMESRKFDSLDPRLKTRYELPLNYQNGIYLKIIGKYEEALKKFKGIAYDANLIGWIRVEQASYSWLATVFYKLENYDLCRNFLSKIDAEYLPKRLVIRDRIYLDISH